MERRPHILFFSHSSKLSGAERSLLDLVLGLKGEGWEVSVVAPAKGPLTAILEERGVPVFVQNFKGWAGKGHRLLRTGYRTLVNLVAYKKLVPRLAGLDVDVIYTNSLAKPMGALIARKLDVPHVWHFREFVAESFGWSFDFGLGPSMKVADRLSDRIVFNSASLRDKFASFFPEPKGVVVYNGILQAEAEERARPKSAPVPGDRIALCIVGIVAEQKRQIDAIKALHHLVESGVDACLRIVGSGPEGYRRKLRELSRRLGVEDRVLWEGYVADPGEIFSSSDISLVCSQFEAFGRVAVEAMAVGTPVVAACSGGLTEIIEDRQTGMLYELGNARMLADQILKLVRNPELYEGLSRRAIASVYRRFTKERYVAEIASLLTEVVSAAEIPSGGTPVRRS